MAFGICENVIHVQSVETCVHCLYQKNYSVRQLNLIPIEIFPRHIYDPTKIHNLIENRQACIAELTNIVH